MPLASWAGCDSSRRSIRLRFGVPYSPRGDLGTPSGGSNGCRKLGKRFEMAKLSSLRVMWFVQPPLAVAVDALGLMTEGSVTGLDNGSSDEQFEALSSGRVDLAVTAMDNVIAWNRRSGPADFRIIAQIERTTPLHLIGRRGMADLAEVRHRSVLVDAPGNGFVVALRAMLAEAGLVGQNCYELDPVGGVKERFDALLAGRGSCTLLGPPFDALAIEAGFVSLATVQKQYPAFPGQGIVARKTVIEALRDPISLWLQALDKARSQAAKDAIQVQSRLMSVGHPPALASAATALSPRSLHPDPEGVALIVQHRRLELPGSEDDYETLVDASLLPAPGCDWH